MKQLFAVMAVALLGLINTRCDGAMESNAGEVVELGGDYTEQCKATDVPGCGTFWFYHIVSCLP